MLKDEVNFQARFMELSLCCRHTNFPYERERSLFLSLPVVFSFNHSRRSKSCQSHGVGGSQQKAVLTPLTGKVEVHWEGLFPGAPLSMYKGQLGNGSTALALAIQKVNRQRSFH